jgi:hypothetical protein
LKAHFAPHVIETLENHDADYERVPPGLTYLNQPVDVGLAKPFKHGVKKRWELYMYDRFDRKLEYETPTREHIARWVKESWDDVDAYVVHNAWRHGPYNLINEPPPE